jgi:hypothetical protein
LRLLTSSGDVDLEGGAEYARAATGKRLRYLTALLVLPLLTGCAVTRPMAQPLAEARYFHAEDAVATATDRIARRILAKLPPDGPVVVALSPVFWDRQNPLFNALVFAGLTTGRDLRLVAHSSAYSPANAKLPVLEVVTLVSGPELRAEKAPAGSEPSWPSATLRVVVLARVHRGGTLLWSDILIEEERERPLELGKS